MRFGPPALSVLSLFQPIQRVLGKHICLRPNISFCLYFFREDHRKKMIAWPKRILSPFIISSPVCIYLLILCLFNYCTCIIVAISWLVFLFLPCAELVFKMAYFFWVEMRFILLGSYTQSIILLFALLFLSPPYNWLQIQDRYAQQVYLGFMFILWHERRAERKAHFIIQYNLFIIWFCT